MDPVALVLRTVLAAVLAASGVAKLADLRGSREAMGGFGVPAGIARAAGLALPLAELAAALGLAVPGLARPAAVLATALFVSMSLAIVRLLAIGQAPDCHCFGRLRSEPVGASTLVRSSTLALAAGLVAVHGAGASLGGAEVVVALGAAAGAWALARRAARRPRLFPDSLLPGARAPRFTLPQPGGGEQTLDALLARGRPTALLFVEPACWPCRALLCELGGWRTGLAGDLSVAVVAKGEAREVEAVDEMRGLEGLLLDEQGSTSKAYGVQATPAAVLVSARGRVARPPAAGRDAIEALLRLALHDSSGELTASSPASRLAVEGRATESR